jgi:hypothetical protein
MEGGGWRRRMEGGGWREEGRRTYHMQMEIRDGDRKIKSGGDLILQGETFPQIFSGHQFFYDF